MGGQVHQDRPTFKQLQGFAIRALQAVIHQRRQFAEGIDGEELGLAMLFGLEVEFHQVVSNALLFHVPARHGCSGPLAAVESEGHGFLFLKV